MKNDLKNNYMKTIDKFKLIVTIRNNISIVIETQHGQMINNCTSDNKIY